MSRSLTSWAAGVMAAILLAAPAAGAQVPPVPPIQLPDPPGTLPGTGPPAAGSNPPRPDRPPQAPCNPPSQPGPVPFAQPTFPCDFPDPMVLRVGGTYYAYGTATGWERRRRAFPILRSTDLRRWVPVGDAFPNLPGWADGHLWGPSVLRSRGRYYLYFSARRRGDLVHCLGAATAERPTGPFQDRGVVACGDRRASGYIDPAPLVHRGRTYLFFSVDRPRHSISVLRLRHDLLRARGARRRLIGVARRWEKGLVSSTVEAPWAMRRGKRFFLFYSAGCWCFDYRMGYAVASNPLGPYRDPGGNPILFGGGALAAPGSGSLVRSHGGRTWLAFHAWTGMPDYRRGGRRTLRVAPLRWEGGRPRPRLGGGR
jgi:beta-xylosidase